MYISFLINLHGEMEEIPKLTCLPDDVKDQLYG